MVKKLTVRHKITGLVSEVDPMTARAFPHLLEEVKPDAKPKVPLGKPSAPNKSTTKGSKDV